MISMYVGNKESGIDVLIDIYNEDCLSFIDSSNLKDKNICIVTDPPFNIGYHYNEYKDNMGENEYLSFIARVVEGVPFVIIHYPEMLYKISAKVGIFPTKVVSWVYNANTKRQHRDIAFFDVVPDFSKVKQPYKNPKDKRIQRLIAEGHEGTDIYDWWFVNQVKNVSKEKTGHPCQMPLEVMKNIVGILPDEYIIFDPFMGSGTTGVACVELDRAFIGCEMNAEYYNIASERISNAKNNQLVGSEEEERG